MELLQQSGVHTHIPTHTHICMSIGLSVLNSQSLCSHTNQPPRMPAATALNARQHQMFFVRLVQLQVKCSQNFKLKHWRKKWLSTVKCQIKSLSAAKVNFCPTGGNAAAVLAAVKVDQITNFPTVQRELEKCKNG